MVLPGSRRGSPRQRVDVLRYGTAIAYAAMQPYALCGTVRASVWRYENVQRCVCAYAACGTEMGYGATGPEGAGRVARFALDAMRVPCPSSVPHIPYHVLSQYRTSHTMSYPSTAHEELPCPVPVLHIPYHVLAPSDQPTRVL
eukprot:814680-Rhodomonas_salina.5